MNKDAFNDEEKEYWNPTYKQIEDDLVVEKLIRNASLLESNRKAHVFCQRALKDLTGAAIQTDGKLATQTVDAINFTTRSGLSKQLRMTMAHYAANYIQSQVRKNEYGNYLKKLFE